VVTTDLNNQSVVVLGGSSGLGFAVAEQAAAQGAKVFALSRSGKAPASTRAVQVDVSDRNALAAAFGSIGQIDHLVHTVGSRFGSTPLASLDELLLPAAFEAKLFSAIRSVRLALPHLAPTASITLTSGQVSRKYGAGSFAKGSLNAAVDAAGRHLAKELAPRRVNVVSPGVVDTNLWGEPGSEARAAIMARTSASLPVRRVGTPLELARAFLFLMTNGFVTGSVLDIDGGGLL
jgi:NAD(P)-dependent dehydrogenase (short-subunit alcohol dehydrogenase family)